MRTRSKLFVFKSMKRETLRGFSRDPKGAGLPAKFAPWTCVGVVRPDQDVPHGLDSVAIEAGLDANGYQLWQVKSA